MEKNLRHEQDLKRREDAESVDNDSNMSTSSNLEPFASDDLGMSTHVSVLFLFLFKYQVQVYGSPSSPFPFVYWLRALLITWNFSGGSGTFFLQGISSFIFNQPVYTLGLKLQSKLATFH